LWLLLDFPIFQLVLMLILVFLSSTRKAPFENGQRKRKSVFSTDRRV